jgi:adenylate cyclase
MNYTAMGDAVNVASRLEGLNKQYGTSIIVSDRIFEDARAHFDFRPLDWVAVKGKLMGQIYELLEMKGEGHNETACMKRRSRPTRRATDKRSPFWNRAEDAPSAILIERRRAFQKVPPPEIGAAFTSRCRNRFV